MANALGTLNVLEAARAARQPPILVYASTNKVYGGMTDLSTIEQPTRHGFRDLPSGVDESRPLDFHSPYGCSKGAADQYVRDYARIYGLPTVVFRQSCIYGPRQLGKEDQGWLAWFVIALVVGRSITVYGDGKQVRDILYVDDLIDAYQQAVERIEVARGQVYNIGGGAQNSISVWWEFKPLIEATLGRAVPAALFAPGRPGDQAVFIADTTKAQRDLGWLPRTSVGLGIQRLVEWVTDHRSLFD
jgi:CDP-paratose 2-epimerase